MFKTMGTQNKLMEPWKVIKYAEGQEIGRNTETQLERMVKSIYLQTTPQFNVRLEDLEC